MLALLLCSLYNTLRGKVVLEDTESFGTVNYIFENLIFK